MVKKQKTVRDWIDMEIKDLNEITGKRFSYSKDMTGYMLTYNEHSEISKRMKGKEFLSHLEVVLNVLRA